MLILCLGSEYFQDSFLKLGHKVVAPPHEDGFPLAGLFDRLTDRPDIIVYTDHLGNHAWPIGLPELNIPKIYYAVDTPINIWWQEHFASLFDLCFVDQKPYVARLEAQGLDSRWLPVAVDTKAYLTDGPVNPEDKVYDFGFVGTVNEKTRPKRSRLVGQLSGRFSLKSVGAPQGGWVGPEEASALYRQSRLVLNENLFPGVTTRMLEAMASGSMLFTEKAGGDLGELFQAGEDFAWFEPQEVLEAAEYWLGDAVRRKRVADRALEKITQGHDITHRAETILAAAQTMNPGGPALTGPKAWDKEGRVLFMTALRWPNENGRARIMRSERMLLKAAEEGALSPEGMFMLGHISRLKGEPDKATLWLTRSWTEGFERAGLGLGILALGCRKLSEAQTWLGRFTGLGEEFPQMRADELHFEAVLPIAAKLMEMGMAIIPGFSLLPHDPALWTAFEFYQSVFNAMPHNLEVGRALSALLLNCGASAEAMEVAGTALSHNPEDELLSQVYSQAARASYLTLN